MNSKLNKAVFGSFYVLLTGALAFFIIYDAGWIIGDDAIVIRKTGWGHFFKPADMVAPASGRFYPFAYIIYNILPVFRLCSVNAHFALHTLLFVLFCAASLWVCCESVATNRVTWQDGVLVLSAAVVCIARAYCNFLDAYSTIWVDYTLVMIWALCCYYVHTKQSEAALIIGILRVCLNFNSTIC